MDNGVEEMERNESDGWWWLAKAYLMRHKLGIYIG